MIHIGCNPINKNNKHIVAETIEFKELNNSKEESFEYFNQRNLIEEFPFEANETYSFYREFIKFKNGLLNNIFIEIFLFGRVLGPIISQAEHYVLPYTQQIALNYGWAVPVLAYGNQILEGSV